MKLLTIKKEKKSYSFLKNVLEGRKRRKKIGKGEKETGKGKGKEGKREGKGKEENILQICSDISHEVVK